MLLSQQGRNWLSRFAWLVVWLVGLAGRFFISHIYTHQTMVGASNLIPTNPYKRLLLSTESDGLLLRSSLILLIEMDSNWAEETI